MALFSDFIISLQDDDNKGAKFEIFSKWFLVNDPYWKTQVDEVWLWKEWPDRWGPDCGIDLVFKSKNGDVWAVQAKCYDEKYSVTKSDMDSFLSESSRAIIDRRLLLSSTNGLSRNAERTCTTQEKPVTLFMLKDFESSRLQYPENISELSKTKPHAKPSPEPHQNKAIKEVVAGLADNDRGQLIMACGTGKTFTTLWIKEALKAKSSLVLVPSLNLLAQTLNEWVYAANEAFNVLCVCSDKTVGKRPKEDMALGEAPFPVTSKSEEITKFLSSKEEKVIFCTYQSLELIEEVYSKNKHDPFDFIIADEAHRCTGSSDSSFSLVLDGKAIKGKKRLFTTATPRLFSSRIKKIAADRGVEMFGMDNKKVFGPVLHILTFGKAIADNLLNNYQVVVVGVDRPMIKDWIDSQKLLSLSTKSLTDARTIAAKIGLLKSIKDYGLSRVISFHSRVDAARNFSSEISDILDLIDHKNKPEGSLWSSYVSGSMSTTQRILEIRKLKLLQHADIGLLTNARCLSEGVDVPKLDGITFIDPKSSRVDIVQSVGRAIRKDRSSKEQKLGTIILPVFIEDGDNAEERIAASNFKPVWDVLTALRSHDELLSENLDRYRTALARKSSSGGGSIDPRIIVNLPQTVDASFAKSITTVIVEATTESWEFWYGLLQNFVDENGHSSVKKDYKTSNGEKLGQWVQGQRQKYAKNNLTKEKVSRLESIPGWSWDPRADLWDISYDNFKKHCTTYGAISAGRKYKTWVDRQRENYKKGTMDPARIERLQKLESWRWDPYSEIWQENYDVVKKHGAINLLRSKKVLSKKEKHVAGWIVAQRNLFNKGKLEKERIKLLEDLPGWAWNTDEALWELGYSSLIEALKTYPNFDYPKTIKTPDGRLLHGWVGRQRHAFNKGELSPDQIKRLEEIDKWVWDVLEAQWEHGFSRLKQFLTTKEMVNLTNSYIDDTNFKLGVWAHVQRRRYAEKVITKAQIDKLEKIDGWLWQFEDVWQENFKIYKKYLENEPYPLIRKTVINEDGVNLSNWANKQRNKYRDGKLSSEQAKQLASIKGWVWDPVTELWESAFASLKTHLSEHGHTITIPRTPNENGIRVRSWVQTQRNNYNKGKLSDERIKRLEALDGWVWEDSLETEWKLNLKKLEELANEYGIENINLDQKLATSNFRSIVTKCRSDYHKGKIDPNRAKALEKIPGWSWDPIHESWMASYSKLVQHCQGGNSPNLGQTFKSPDNFTLGRWVHAQKNSHKAGKLENRYVSLLEKLNEWSWEHN